MFKRIRSSLVFWIFLVYSGAMLGHLAWRTVLTEKTVRETRGFYLQHALRVSRPLLKERIRELHAYLDEAVEMGLVDFYELEQTGRPTVSGGSGPAEKPPLAETVSAVGGWVWGKAEAGNATLRLATGVGWRSRLAVTWAGERERLPTDLLFLLLASGLSFFFQSAVKRNQTAHSEFREGRKAKVLRTVAPPPATPEAKDFSGVFARTLLLLPEGMSHDLGQLEAFFVDAAGLLARYHGKVHSLHGHELLAFFCGQENNEQPATLALLAAAAARDIEKLAEGQGLRAATSLAYGRFHGAPVLGSFALFGAAVDETSALRGGRRPGLHCAESFQKARGKHSIPELAATLEMVRCGNSEAAEGLTFHRSDAALTEILRALSGDENWSREAFVAITSTLRGVTCCKCGPEVREGFRALLARELATKDSYRLSSALALAPHVLNRALVDKDLEKMFLAAVGIRDRRVRANAVELFTRFFPEREIAELRPLVKDEDNRVSANALIKAACERFDEKVIAKIDERLRGGSVAHVASALHAVGEIAAYYRRTDPLFLGTKIAFLRLFDSVPEWALHPNPMIRRQALIAAHKLGSSVVNARLHSLFHEARDPELLLLFETIFGWKKPADERVEVA